jgi:hypothetical protein
MPQKSVRTRDKERNVGVATQDALSDSVRARNIAIAGH